jgi:hypothetical protein
MTGYRSPPSQGGELAALRTFLPVSSTLLFSGILDDRGRMRIAGA